MPSNTYLNATIEERILSSDRPRRIWITGASKGLGHALAQALLEQGCQVAISVQKPGDARALEENYPDQVLVLPYNLRQLLQVKHACRDIRDRWQSIDCLIINAGTGDYLSLPVTDTIIQDIVQSNLDAASHCLSSALPLLERGRAPQVVAILSAYATLQLHEASQPARPANSIPMLFDESRALLGGRNIDLTVVAAQTRDRPVTDAPAMPGEWPPEAAASAILERLDERPKALVLQALNVNELWPLPT